MKYEIPVALIVVAAQMVSSTIAAYSPNAVDVETGTNGSSERLLHASYEEGTSAGAARESFTRPFAELAPRQKVMGLVNAVALLRTKIFLIEQMQSAFEPQTIPTNAGPQPGRMLPGPALAYGDCRLGILGFEVCRHMGFLEGDPMVAPSSLQSKMLTLVGASSVISSLKKGQLHLHDDEELTEIMGADLVDSAVRALGACWNAQLLYPTFDARPVKMELFREATNYADEFLFLTAANAKKIIRFSRASEHDDVAIWLAWILSDTPGSETAPLYSGEATPNAHREEPQRKPENVADTPTGKPKQAAPIRSYDDALIGGPQQASYIRSTDDGLIGGFLNRFFPSSSQTSQSHQGGFEKAPTTAFTALANTVGNLTSVVTSTAQNAVKLVNNEGTSEVGEDATAHKDNEMRLASILSMIPDEVDRPI